MFRQRTPKLHRCPLCGSEGVSGWFADQLAGTVLTRVLLTCAECSTSRRLVASIWEVDAYARRHDRQRCQIAVALHRSERDRMAADVRLLAEALRHDLIGPDDFTARRAARAPT